MSVKAKNLYIFRGEGTTSVIYVGSSPDLHQEWKGFSAFCRSFSLEPVFVGIRYGFFNHLIGRLRKKLKPLPMTSNLFYQTNESDNLLSFIDFDSTDLPEGRVITKSARDLLSEMVEEYGEDYILENINKLGVSWLASNLRCSTSHAYTLLGVLSGEPLKVPRIGVAQRQKIYQAYVKSLSTQNVAASFSVSNTTVRRYVEMIAKGLWAKLNNPLTDKPMEWTWEVESKATDPDARDAAINPYYKLWLQANQGLLE